MSEIFDVVQKLPAWVIGLWIILVAGVASLIAITARYAKNDTIPTIDSRLRGLTGELATLSRASAEHSLSLEEHSNRLNDLIFAVAQLRPVHIGTLRLNPPDPPNRIDWRTAIADAAGATDAKHVDPAIVSQLFTTIEQSTALVNLVAAGKLRILSLTLRTLGPDGAGKSAGTKYVADLTVRNETNENLKAVLPRGQVFENTSIASGYQNLIAAESLEITINADSSTAAAVSGYCFNKGKNAPIRQQVNISPLRIRFEFADQQALWDRTHEIVTQMEK